MRLSLSPSTSFSLDTAAAAASNIVLIYSKTAHSPNERCLHKHKTQFDSLLEPFDAHCCRMGTAIKHPVPDRVKPSLVIFDIRMSVRVPGCQKLQLHPYGNSGRQRVKQLSER